MLAIKGLNKSFGENEILKKIDLNIEKGKVIAILGPSGSGKTTVASAPERFGNSKPRHSFF